MRVKSRRFRVKKLDDLGLKVDDPGFKIDDPGLTVSRRSLVKVNDPGLKWTVSWNNTVFNWIISISLARDRMKRTVQFPNFCRPFSCIQSFYLVIDQLFISSLWLQSGVNINGDNTSKTTWRTCFGIKSEINNLI